MELPKRLHQFDKWLGQLTGRGPATGTPWTITTRALDLLLGGIQLDVGDEKFDYLSPPPVVRRRVFDLVIACQGMDKSPPTNEALRRGVLLSFSSEDSKGEVELLQFDLRYFPPTLMIRGDEDPRLKVMGCVLFSLAGEDLLDYKEHFVLVDR